jgi:hypothetical protein
MEWLAFRAMDAVGLWMPYGKEWTPDECTVRQAIWRYDTLRQGWRPTRYV